MGFRFKKQDALFEESLKEELTRWSLLTHKPIDKKNLTEKLTSQRFLEALQKGLLERIEKTILAHEISLSLVQGNLDVKTAEDLVTLAAQKNPTEKEQSV